MSTIGIAVVIGVWLLDSGSITWLDPDSRFAREELLNHWRLAVALGLLFGFAGVAWTVRMHQKHYDFFVKYYALPRRERRKQPFRGVVLRKLALPIIFGCWAFIATCVVSECALTTAYSAAMIPLALQLPSSNRMLAAADAYRKTMLQGAS